MMFRLGRAWRLPIVPLVVAALAAGLIAASLAVWIATQESDGVASAGSQQEATASGTTGSPKAAGQR